MRFKSVSLLDLRVRPSRLIDAKEVVLERYEKYVSSSTNEKKWPRIYKKIQNREKLRLRELKYALFKTDILNEEECSFLLTSVSKDFNSPEIVSSLFSGVMTLMKPWKSVGLLLRLDSKLCSSIENIEFFSKNRDVVIKSSNVDSFAESICQSATTISDLKDLQKSSATLNKLTISFVQANTLDTVFRDDTNMLLDFLFDNLKNDTFLTLVDRYIGNFLLDNKNWSSQILDSSYTLNKLIEFILNKKIVITSFGERLKTVYDKYLLTSDFISELRGLSKERADYWEFKIKNFDAIEVRKFGSRKFGMAMYLKKYVVVEFAPVGNAAYFYTKDVFNEVIKDSSNWSNKDSSGINVGQGSYTLRKEFRDLKNGSFSHSGNWTRRMDRILQVITNV